VTAPTVPTATRLRPDDGYEADTPWSEEEFEQQLRTLATSRYHDRHPFNQRMHAGTLNPDELRRWVLNRFHYQRHIPVKDALILAKLDSPQLRRSWLRRIQDHDGREGDHGGIERWLRLGEAVGLDRTQLWSGGQVLPGVRFAVESYVNLCRDRPVLEAVASSLTELVAPTIMVTRIGAFQQHYTWIEPEGLAYFERRVDQGTRDGQEALAWVTAWAGTRRQQQAALDALATKCEVLWSLLDAIALGSSGSPC
jgi:pyrroloquinoline-quinone synthase